MTSTLPATKAFKITYTLAEQNKFKICYTQMFMWNINLLIYCVTYKSVPTGKDTAPITA